MIINCETCGEKIGEFVSPKLAVINGDFNNADSDTNIDAERFCELLSQGLNELEPKIQAHKAKCKMSRYLTERGLERTGVYE